MKTLFSLIAVLFFSVLTQAQGQKVDSIVAIVNNETILESDLRKFVSRLDKGGLIDDILLADKKISQLKSDRKAQLEILIDEKILDSEVKRLNLTVTIERVEQEIRSVARKNNISRGELVAALKAQGVSISDYQDFMKTKIERQSLIESEVTSKIRVGEEDILARYLQKNKGADNSLFENTLAHIVFNPKKGGPEASLERAKKALARIQNGEAFEVVAEQTSEDTNFTPGGAFGTFKSGELQKTLDDAVARLNVGEVSGVIQTRMGWQILKLLSRKVVPDPKYEKQKEQIQAQLSEEAFKKQFGDWLALKKQDSFIRIN